jgi:hypothetical protein
MQKCPLGKPQSWDDLRREQELDSQRYNPKNAGVALAHVLHDHAEIVYKMALAEQPIAVEQVLQAIENQIKFFRKTYGGKTKGEAKRKSA